MFDLYQQQILDRYKNPHHKGHIETFTHQADGANYVCGDEIHWEISLDEQGSVTGLKHDTRACAICTASADLLADQFLNQPAQKIPATTAEAVTELLGIPLSPTRLKCALLPLETLKQALEEA